MKCFLLIVSLLMFILITPVFGQDESIDYSPVEINIDSLIQDSLRKAFILNHRPLSEQEKNLLLFDKERSVYGSYANYYLKNVGWFSLNIPKERLYSTMRRHQNLEWIFYSFLFLFLFTALLSRYSNGLLRNLWKSYVNDGFINRLSKDQISQQPVISILLNILFIFSTGLFIFFGLNLDQQFTGNMRWLILACSFFIIALVYLFKHLFFKILGWAFGQEQAFNDYLFVVFLNNKLAGLLLLFSSFFMSFSDSTSSSMTFNLSLFVVVLMLLYRFLRGYQVFSKQCRIGFFSLLLAFIALELIPSAVLVKFLTRSVGFYFDVIL